MGNCLFGGMGDPTTTEESTVVKVITSNGGIMEFHTPITAGCIAGEFPGHAVFPTDDLFWRPLPPDEDLPGGFSYYLLPVNSSAATPRAELVPVREGHVRSKSIPTSKATPYRMSLDLHHQGTLKRSYTDVLSIGRGVASSKNKCGGVQYNGGRRRKVAGKGYWKVRLVITPEQLVEILSQQDSIEELIESVRAVAKYGGGGGRGEGGVFSSSSAAEESSAAFSEEWSRSSSRNASSKKDGLPIIDP